MTDSEVWLIRHGETEWSAAGRHTGRTDLPLTDAGRAAAESLRGRLPADPALVLVSPLQRATETCRLAGYEPQATDDDLREWDYGSYEGRTTPQIRADQPGWTVWHDGCPGGETAADVGLRADRVVARLRATSGTTLVFSHGHMLRVLGARWVGLPAADGALLALDTARVSVLGWEREQPVLRRWNA